MWVSDPSGGTLKVGFNLSERIQHGTLNQMVEKELSKLFLYFIVIVLLYRPGFGFFPFF